MRNKCRIAIVGAGVIGQKHAALIRASAVAELVGICDSDGSRVQVAEQFQAPFYQTREELLVRERPAGVIVATPNHLHAPVAELCAAHGVHLLVEKPSFICGEIIQVYAQSSSAIRGFAVEDSLTATLTFANGAFGSVLLSDAAAAPWSYEATTGENPLYFRTAEDCYHFVGTAGALAFPTMQLWQYADPQPDWLATPANQQSPCRGTG